MSGLAPICSCLTKHRECVGGSPPSGMLGELGRVERPSLCCPPGAPPPFFKEALPPLAVSHARSALGELGGGSLGGHPLPRPSDVLGDPLSPYSLQGLPPSCSLPHQQLRTHSGAEKEISGQSGAPGWAEHTPNGREAALSWRILQDATLPTFLGNRCT